MKNRTILLLTVIMLTNLSLYAQDDDEPKIGGIRAGFHSAYMVNNGEKPDTANSLNNFYIGFFHEKKIASMFYWGSGLEYFQNGTKHDNGNKNVLHTLSIPLDLKFKIGPLYALGGAAANFKIAEKNVINDNSYNPSESGKISLGTY